VASEGGCDTEGNGLDHSSCSAFCTTRLSRRCFITRMSCSVCKMCSESVFSDIVEGMWKVCFEKDSVGVEG
jgi:hypothetical protein